LVKPWEWRLPKDLWDHVERASTITATLRLLAHGMRLERSAAPLWALDIPKMGLDLGALPNTETVVEWLAGARAVDSRFAFAEQYRPAVAGCVLAAAARLEDLQLGRATPDGCDVARVTEKEDEIVGGGVEELVLWVRRHVAIEREQRSPWIAQFLTMIFVCDNAMMES